jgi:hypothetical protein
MQRSALAWVVAAIVVIAIVALLAYARNDPGVGGRVPDPEDAMSLVVAGSDHGPR